MCFLVRGRKNGCWEKGKGKFIFFLLRSTRHPRASANGLAWFGVGQSKSCLCPPFGGSIGFTPTAIDFLLNNNSIAISPRRSPLESALFMKAKVRWRWGSCTSKPNCRPFPSSDMLAHAIGQALTVRMTKSRLRTLRETRSLGAGGKRQRLVLE